MFALYVFVVFTLPPDDTAITEAAAEEVPMAEEPMAVEPMDAEPAVEAEAAFETPPPPLGDYTVTFTGAAPIPVGFSQDGTFVIGTASGGRWSYDSDGVLCVVFDGSSINNCFVKLNGSNEYSTWRNVADESEEFVLERVAYAAAE